MTDDRKENGASGISRNLSDSAYERPEGPRYGDDGDVAPIGSFVESGTSMYRAERFESDQPFLDLPPGDSGFVGSVRRQAAKVGASVGASASDFAVLMTLADFELADLVEHFSVSFDVAASWHRGDSQPPAQVRLALRQIGQLNPASPRIEGTLHEGDCLNILPQLTANSIDLILCDLPYGTTQNRWDSVIDLRLLWKEYRRVLKPNGAVVLTSQGIFTARLILSNEAWFKYKIVWEKSKPTNFLNAKKQPLRKHEDVCVFYGKPPTYNPQMQAGAAYDKGIRKNQLSGSYGDFQPAHVRSDGGRYPADIVYFKTAESEPERSVWHPTQKPVALARYLVRTYSNEGDVVLDNAFGSGSFLVAAAIEKRRFIGIERNQEVHLFKDQRIDYVALAAERLERVGARTNIARS